MNHVMYMLCVVVALGKDWIFYLFLCAFVYTGTPDTFFPFNFLFFFWTYFTHIPSPLVPSASLVIPLHTIHLRLYLFFPGIDVREGNAYV
ncbi:hypothetical protein BDZ91DRAFT_743141 [Kalaharituber pfeilii]|nr:hypothetical protein BDZ91DRAFT_743141 [Kalaharituber pfeilii]